MMRVLGHCPWSVTLAVIMLGGCSAFQSDVSSILPDSASGAALAPERAPAIREKGPLLYVSDVSDNVLYVFSLPSGRLVQKITGFAAIEGVCSDTEGNVFVTDQELASIKEYAHGGNEPIAILNDPDAFPTGCSADPVSGNLAVANLITTNSTGKGEPGDVVVYKNEKGKPKAYVDPNLAEVNSDSYDSSGDLYVSGATGSGRASDFAVLPEGAGRLSDITLNQGFGGFAPLQWDGQDLAVASYADNDVYRFSINGTTGTNIGKTKLGALSSVDAFWIQNNELYAAGFLNHRPMVRFYPYPKGGRPTKSILGFSDVAGATVSTLP
jgi:hypothetical protein